MTFKKLVEKYKERYYISYLDLADAGESNRIVVHIASIILFWFSLFFLGLYLILYRSELSNHRNTFIYYAIYVALSIYSYFASKQRKEPERLKVYLENVVPLYIMMFVIFGEAVFNCIDGFYFNGFITFCITAIILLAVCYFSPLIFLLAIIITISCMAPGLIQAFGITGFLNCLILVVLMFGLSLYKRRIEKKHIMFLKKQKQNLEAKTFGNFTLIYEGKVVSFTRSKSPELIGYLIYKNGTSVKTKELLTVLYGDRADSAHCGANLRNLIVDIRHTLADLGIQNFFMAEYNNFRINPEVIKCDYYDFLAGDPKAIKGFVGEFMNQFSWAEDVAALLEQKAFVK